MTSVELTAQRLEVADIVVAVDHTPGHTPGSVVFRVSADTDEGPARSLSPVTPWGSAGSAAATTTRTLGRCVVPSATKLLVLGDDTVVLPGHGTSTTIGGERRFNPYCKDLTQ